jgi:3-phenylpropionate/trans-cinnamate dioxygenase ferredoxin reductase subunit
VVMIDGKKTPDFRVHCPLNPSSVVIVGAGASGAACAEKLRAKGYDGPVTLVGDEEPGPVDRPNLSKDFLAGTATEDWIPLRTREYYESIQVELITSDPAVRFSPADHQVSLRSGRILKYGALLLATGAEPRSRVCDPQGGIWQFSFFVYIILTYTYVRIGGALCLSPSPPSNSSAPAY